MSLLNLEYRFDSYRGYIIETSFISMVQIYRKEGWILNTNDKIVNAILKRCEMNNGECPCHNESVDKHCPCSDYRERNICHCGLYMKVNGE